MKIPNNLEECFEVLNSVLSSEDIEEFKNMSEKKAGAITHFGLGRTLRNKWNLWNEENHSGLKEYFEKMGIWHADDMSGIILDSYHRHLNDKNLKLDEQVKFYKDYWKK